MMPLLSPDKAANLALQYNFSGGQIENIARKSTIENIIHGIEPSLDKLKEFCDTEILGRENSGSLIGFRV
jgi:hypothetical protein